MKVNFLSPLLLLVVGSPVAAAPTTSDCKNFCKEARVEVLGDRTLCQPAIKQPGGHKIFDACVEGRKRAFDQSCMAGCLGEQGSLTSFQGCQAAKRKGAGFVGWCRKGYDSILQVMDTILARANFDKIEEGLKGEDAKNEEVVWKDEPAKHEPVESEPVEIELDAEVTSEQEPVEQPAESKPVKSEPAKTEPVEDNPAESQSFESDQVDIQQPEPVKSEDDANVHTEPALRGGGESDSADDVDGRIIVSEL